MSAHLVAEKTLIDQLLEEQQTIAPVAKFASLHENDSLSNEEKYKDIIPLSKPGKGEQYAFEVYVDQCTGCKGCVTACHSLNGLDEDEAWRDVGMLYGGDQANPVIQTVTTACHHCIDPGCLNGCPVEAYEKDPITGIVHHLDDQCIGCQYCVLKCPYDVPKYNESKGIVRKCDMCQNRLAVNEAPACVQACPNEAIHIVKVDVSRTMDGLQSPSDFLPGTPDPTYTKPTTQYVSARGIPSNLQAADQHTIRPEQSHMPLVIMLTLTQVSVGMFVADYILRIFNISGLGSILLTLASAIGLIGLMCSFLHLGQPLKAWRFFLGLRKSWLSREILAFNLFLLPMLALTAGEWFQSDFSIISPEILSVLSFISAYTGLLAVYCSIMIYHDTQRVFWHFKQTAPRFFGTTLIFTLLFSYGLSETPSILPLLFLVCASMVKLGIELQVFRYLNSPDGTSLKKTALLMRNQFKEVTFSRFLLLILGGILIPVTASILGTFSWPVFAICGILLISGELLERYLFFRTVTALKMPGNI
jgi:Fe-S-cluster-containing dehydrogenase component/DMSO reductase anchor subunit